MSGSLAVLDRLGREVKRFPLASGVATIGRGAACDIRVMLPSVLDHHATIAIHDNQAILRSVESGGTRVNGRAVSVWRLRPGDRLDVGGRELRWSGGATGGGGGTTGGGTTGGGRRGRAPTHILVHKKVSTGRVSRRASAASSQHNRLRLELDALHRASMPATAGGKQVAVVQPQRREAAESHASSSKSESVRVSSPAVNTTQASLWIESRKSVRSPLRVSVLRKHAVLKIPQPHTIDHTKQAALLLMTGHSPKPRVSQNTTPARSSTNGRKSSRGGKSSTPKTPGSGTRNTRSTTNSPSVVEISSSPALGSPRKSAMKDPKRSSRKNESIKFDLSNLQQPDDEEPEANSVATRNSASRNSDINSVSESESVSDSELTLRYSDASSVKSPSPRRSIHSRSSKILQSSVGATLSDYSLSATRTLTPESPQSRKSTRGSIIIQKALESSKNDSRRKSLPENSKLDNRTRTLSPRKSNVEGYSIVDLVSIDSSEAGKHASVYNPADSINSSATTYKTPRNSEGRKSTRASRTTLPSFLGSSTPYVAKQNRSKRSNSSPNISNVTATRSSVSTRRSKSVTTPDNTYISVNSTRISRASRYRSRLDSDLMQFSSDDASPKTSRRVSKNKSAIANKTDVNRTITLNDSELENSGLVTPENRRSPVEAATPVLNIQSLLNSSQSSLVSNISLGKGKRNSKRQTIGVTHEASKRGLSDIKSTSLYLPARKALRLSSDESPPPDDVVVTPKSAVKLVQEAVKNKHSTAKKPQSKRSIIDNLDESDFVKQLFNSPVKRKLSHSITEFSRKHLNEDDFPEVRRPARKTTALTRNTLSNSLLNNSIDFTEAFVSPLSSPGKSPNLSTVKRLFNLENSPKNDLRNVSGVKSLLRSPRPRRSVKNDLTKVSGVKKVFRKSPKNRLSDVRGVKEMFQISPDNDLRRVSGVKSLFKQNAPNNDLTDVRGVKALFTRNSPRNDYTNVSGVKKTFQRGPKNDLSDVRGVKQMYGRKKRQTDYTNVSGIEDLFNDSAASRREAADDVFDQLLGKQPIKAVYSKSFTKNQPKKYLRTAKSLHSSIEVSASNVEKWLEDELQKRLHRDEGNSNSSRGHTQEVEAVSRSRRSTATASILEPVSGKKSASQIYSARKLPIKKRSLVNKSQTDKSVNKSKNLPIKKRVVVHSTPVKGRYNVTMNASELGRVSPIVADKTKQINTSATDAKLTPKPKTPRGRKSAKQAPQTIPEVHSPPKVSPKKTRGRPARATAEAKTTRTRTNAKNDDTPVTNVKKRRTSLVIVKKSPIAKPKPAKKTAPLEEANQAETPKKTRGNRRQKPEVVASPKRNTRAKVRRSSVVVSKPSPKMKPQSSRARKTEPSTPVSTSKTRKTAPKQTKTSKAAAPTPSKPAARRGAKAVETVKSPKPKRGKTQPEAEKPKRGRKAQEPSATQRASKTATEVETKRGRRNVVVESPKPVPTRRGRNQTAPPATARGRKQTLPKTKDVTQSPDKTETKTRGRKLQPQTSTQSEPTRRGRKADNDTAKSVAPARTRTKVDKLPTPKKQSTKKLEKSHSEEVEKKTRGRKTADQTQVETRRKRNESVVNDKPATRKKTPAAVVEEKPARGGRKRKSDAPDSKKLPAKKSRKSVEQASPVKRATRNKKPAEVPEKPRSHRR